MGNNTEWLTSLEGWNFDKLAERVHKWQRVGNKNFYVSELFKVGTLYLQLLKSYDRVVGMVERDCYDSPVIFKLGNWSRTTSKQLTQYANDNQMIVLNVSLMSQDVIDILQEGFR